ncbi:MAG: Xaa-Pro peptidase family protein [Hyphomicrobiaceae bacterium]
MSEPRPSISRAEFADRRQRAAAMAKVAGLRGLVVAARGGGSLDRYGDVMYLTNFYTLFPYIPDLAGNWNARAHTFLVLSAEGEARLVVDCAYDETVALDASEIIRADLVVEGVIGAMRELGLDKGPVGLVGGDVMTVDVHQAISAALPAVRWQTAQGILATLRALKSPAEIALLRRASRLGSRATDAMMAAAQPGATHGDVIAAGQAVIAPAGAILYNSFMSSGTGGDGSPEIRTGFPTWASPVALKEGQWFHIGLSGVLDGYYFDLARSRPIGKPTNRQIDLFETAIAAVGAGIGAIRPGVTAEAVAAAGLGKQVQLGFELKGNFSGLGHGVGLGWDSPWLAPGDKTILEPGMVLCVERGVRQDGFLGDFEETVIVTETGAEMITDAQVRYW